LEERRARERREAGKKGRRRRGGQERGEKRGRKEEGGEGKREERSGEERKKCCRIDPIKINAGHFSSNNIT
jgi:hypothetical protein